MTWSDSVLQCAQALVLYSALILIEQMWHVLWLHGATAVCCTGEAQMKQTSASSSSSTASSATTGFAIEGRTSPYCPSATAGALPLFAAGRPPRLFAPSPLPRPPLPRPPAEPPLPRPRPPDCSWPSSAPENAPLPRPRPLPPRRDGLVGPCAIS